MRILSSAFEEGEEIPTRYTADGDDISPPLFIHDLPEGTKSFAIVMDDPDAPLGVFDHWIAWNISPLKSHFEEGFQPPKQGTNDFGDRKYRGPAPPPGNPHHYLFKLYALDALLDLADGASKQDLERAMETHILEQAKLSGIYGR